MEENSIAALIGMESNRIKLIRFGFCFRFESYTCCWGKNTVSRISSMTYSLRTMIAINCSTMEQNTKKIHKNETTTKKTNRKTFYQSEHTTERDVSFVVHEIIWWYLKIDSIINAAA